MISLKLNSSVADPYHFDTDLDPGCEKICYGSGSRANFDTDPDPGEKGLSTVQETSLKSDEKR